MPDYQQSDTFLSRVFGLHSVYNQINDNYQYYDDEEEQSGDTYDRLGSTGLVSGILDPPSNKNTIKNTNNLLDSDNGSDDDDDYDVEDEDEEGSGFGDISLNSNLLAPTNQQPQQLQQQQQQQPQSKSFVSTIFNNKQANVGSGAPPIVATNATNNNRGAVAFELPLYHKKPAQQSTSPSIQTVFQKKNRHNNLVIPPKERALYLWANIINMDEFLQDIYYYYRGNGYLNIALTRIVDLLILVFILSFTIFLKYGIDYDAFLQRHDSTIPITLHAILKPLHLPFSVKFFLTGFIAYIVLRLVQLYFDLNYKLREIHNFYKYLINISDDNELMTISWSTIVERLMLLKDYNGLTTSKDPHYINDLSSKVRLDAHDIANRIMRKENYMIGLINKNVLDFNLKLPFFPVNTLTRTLEWNLQLCINNFVFNQHGQINPSILKEVNRNKLSLELKSRFQMAAIINLILCPFIVTYFVLLYFFKYFNEYKTNPGSLLGIRQYTPLAEWKLREFNELQHFFLKRLQLSIKPANTYINQFPRGFLVINTMKLVNFISGSFMAILVIFGLWFDDEEHNFWSFELSENKSSLFYISIFGTIWAITNVGSDSGDENGISIDGASGVGGGGGGGAGGYTDTFFYDPEASLRYVSQFTHYLPSSWNGKLHTIEVKNEFCDMYRLKVLTILNELMSLVLTPFILWFNIANSSSLIIDFFRDYSIHVDGLGYVCYFAMFNFEEKDKNMMYDLNKKKKKKRNHRNSRRSGGQDAAPGDTELDLLKKRKGKAKVSDEYESDDSDDSDLNYDSYQDEKMIKSYMYFLESYDNKKKPASKINNQKGQLNPSKSPKTDIQPNVPRQRNVPESMIDHSMAESMYNINYKFDDIEEPKAQKSGVIGMLNQFYKHTDIGR
ncbi:autophagy-related protein 9 [[Candida] railenensis]|uniref:Autophagy-related protein 9 n=1 Tax=[Candida] railenensis TaxID=45579 RepID=A0A9P0VWG5_9ASCO|nr:autophagy-related protein 9 [[Candida] railenensis]